MATTTDIIEDIKADLTLLGSEYDSLLLRCVQTSLRELRGRRLWFLEGFSTVTATPGSETIDLATALPDFSAIDVLDIIADGQRYYNSAGFDRLSFNDLRALYWQETTIESGRPEAWAIRDKTIYLSHIPQTAYSFPITYYRQDATLPGAGGTSIWFDDGYDAIRARAQYIYKRDSDGMTLQEADRDMMLMAENALGETHINKTWGSY